MDHAKKIMYHVEEFCKTVKTIHILNNSKKDKKESTGEKWSSISIPTDKASIIFWALWA